MQKLLLAGCLLIAGVMNAQNQTPRISPAEASQYLGKKVIISAKVKSIRNAQDTLLFVNLEVPPQCSTLQIFTSKRAIIQKCSELLGSLHAGDSIEVTGYLRQYKDRLEIPLNYCEQITK